MPEWLVDLSMLSLGVSSVCAALIALDILLGRRQHMAIMNLVWPISALYFGPVGLWAYLVAGRPSARSTAQGSKSPHDPPPGREKPFWLSVAIGTSHCGAGCTLGDLIAESFLILVPLSLFGHPMFAAWTLDYVLAFGIGIAFQYFTIQPMRGLSVRKGLVAAVKADALSLTAWQIGMYGWMAVCVFLIFGHDLDKTGPVFWFMMQIAMVAGFITAYPVNWWLLRTGIKETM